MSSFTEFVWGQIPQTAGNVYWVAPAASYNIAGTSAGRGYSASDDNDGLDPRRALLTIDRAWNLVTADAGDVIVLLPGTHSPAASIAADVAGVTMTGLPAGSGNFFRQKTAIDAVTGDQNINVTAADIEIAFLHLVPVTADSAIDLSADADRCHIHHCSFDMATAAASTGTMGVDVIGAASNVLIENCYFECDGAQGPAITVGAAIDSLIQDCVASLSTGTWAAAMVTAAAVDRVIIRRCTFHAGNATITAGILGTTGGSASAVQINDCRFADSVTVAVDTYDAGTAEIAENYQAGVGATDGGVLVVAID